jgi:hypothetical protein
LIARAARIQLIRLSGVFVNTPPIYADLLLQR